LIQALQTVEKLPSTLKNPKVAKTGSNIGGGGLKGRSKDQYSDEDSGNEGGGGGVGEGGGEGGGGKVVLTEKEKKDAVELLLKCAPVVGRRVAGCCRVFRFVCVTEET